MSSEPVRVKEDSEAAGEGTPWGLDEGHEVKPDLVLCSAELQAPSGASGPVTSESEIETTIHRTSREMPAGDSRLDNSCVSKSLRLSDGEKSIALKPCYVKLERIVNKNKYKCKMCQITFTRNEALTRHVRSLTHIRNASRSESNTACHIFKEGSSIHSDGDLLNANKSCHTNNGEKHMLVKPCFVKLELIDKKRHKCQICRRRFARKYGLKRHIVTHTQEQIDSLKKYKNLDIANKFKCDICGNMLARHDSLVSHLRIHAKQDPFRKQLRMKIPRGSIIKSSYTCDICGKQLTRKCSLARHLLSHNEQGPYVCLDCEKQFRVAWDFVNHIKLGCNTDKETVTDTPRSSNNILKDSAPKSGSISHNEKKVQILQTFNGTVVVSDDASSDSDRAELETNEETYYCGVCEQQFKTLSSLNDHKCAQPKRPFSCKVCKKKFRIQVELRDHMRKHTGEKPFSCEICKKGFRIAQYLKTHMRTHTGEKPFKCTICNKQFSQINTLTGHSRIHTGEKPFSCQFCTKRFRLKSTLENHERIHTGETPYACEFCPKQFRQNTHLKIHRRTHSGEKPYNCDICKRVFLVKSNLVYHNRVHHNGEKPFKCKICQKQFAFNSYLSNHMESHTKSWEYSCEVCKRKFQRKQYLWCHMKKWHKDV